MLFCALVSLLSWLIDLATLRVRSDRSKEKELEILLLRRQLAILQRAQARPVRPSRRERLGLAVLAGKLRALPAAARTRVRGASSSSPRRRSRAGIASWCGGSGRFARTGQLAGRRVLPRSRR
jgi:hypothetical protein